MRVKGGIEEMGRLLSIEGQLRGRESYRSALASVDWVSETRQGGGEEADTISPCTMMHLQTLRLANQTFTYILDPSLLLFDDMRLSIIRND